MIKNKKGFTLIELIIVMAIVGILAVVAVVAISSKAGDARDARRRSDLSAVQTAFALYTSDGSGATAVHGTITAPAVLSTGTDPGTYMDVSNVADPSSTYVSTGVCVVGTVGQDSTCGLSGDYTILEAAGVDDVGSFSAYKIGATLEAGTWIYVTQLGISS